MNNNLRKTVFFILLLAVTYLAYQFMIKPANKSLAEQQTQVDKKLSKLNEFEKATAAVEDLNTQLVELQNAIDSFESKLPPKSEIHKVLEQVTVIAQKQGLHPKTIRTLAKKENDRYVEQPLKMELVGNFNSFYSFLLELEQLPRIMKIHELRLSKLKDEDVTADFVVSVFFLST